MMNSGAKSPADLMAEDLAKSGLIFTDVMGRVLDENSKSQVGAHDNTRGYVIPYFNIYGKLTQYYRAKILFNKEVKYLQIRQAPNHIYFPQKFQELFFKQKGNVCIIVEGEKKAALLAKCGIPCVGLSGVDSYRNKTLILPKGTETSQKDGRTVLKLAHAEIDEGLSPFAIGFEELLNLGIEHKTTFIICFDTDSSKGLTMGPQRAAARLGFELRFKGFSLKNVRQLIIPYSERRDPEGNATVEDIILKEPSVEQGVEKFLGLINECLKKRVAFPRHPLIREHVAKQLQKARLDRKSAQNVALSVLTELDSRGTRMFAPDDLQMYYFNGDNNHLMKVDINSNQIGRTQESEFGILLYRDYSISVNADTGLMKWLGSQFAAEDPVEKVRPYKLLARPKPNEDIMRFQINNGQYIKVSADPQKPYTIMANGAENTLFESQNLHIDGIDEVALKEELKKQHGQSITPWWQEVIREVKLRHPGRAGDLIALLYYISPWLLGWRGIQLPIEIVTGEAGSGKSTLCEIRLNILTGDPKLRNSPHDQKDWYATLASTGGLVCTDNVQMTDKNLRQNMSDELCRLVTEAFPRINMRKYFTEADERTINVNSVFCFTAIQPPFQNSDLIQRSISLELTKSLEDDPNRAIFDSQWKDRQVQRFGGRAAWVAHHCVAIHRFYKLVNEKWNHNYRAQHRLVHFEQSLVLMAQVMGMEYDWIPQHLATMTDQAITSADWTMEGLAEFADMMRQTFEMAKKNNRFKESQKPTTIPEWTSADVAEWATEHTEHAKCHQLVNSRSLGRYMSVNKHNLSHIAGIVEVGRRNNLMHYKAVPISAKIQGKTT